MYRNSAWFIGDEETKCTKKTLAEDTVHATRFRSSDMDRGRILRSISARWKHTPRNIQYECVLICILLTAYSFECATRYFAECRHCYLWTECVPATAAKHRNGL